MGAITAELVDTGGKRMRVVVGWHRPTAGCTWWKHYGASGLTMAAFARREGIKHATFADWVLKAQKPRVAKSGVKFADIADGERGGGGYRFEVRLTDGTVLRGQRVADLVALVRALCGKIIQAGKCANAVARRLAEQG